MSERKFSDEGRTFLARHEATILERCEDVARNFRLCASDRDELHQNVCIKIGLADCVDEVESPGAFISKVAFRAACDLKRANKRWNDQTSRTVQLANAQVRGRDQRRIEEVRSALSGFPFVPEKPREVLVAEALRRLDLAPEEHDSVAAKTSTNPKEYLRTRPSLSQEAARARLHKAKKIFLQFAGMDALDALRSLGFKLACVLALFAAMPSSLLNRAEPDVILFGRGSPHREAEFGGGSRLAGHGTVDGSSRPAVRQERSQIAGHGTIDRPIA